MQHHSAYYQTTWNRTRQNCFLFRFCVSGRRSHHSSFRRLFRSLLVTFTLVCAALVAPVLSPPAHAQATVSSSGTGNCSFPYTTDVGRFSAQDTPGEVDFDISFYPADILNGQASGSWTNTTTGVRGKWQTVGFHDDLSSADYADGLPIGSGIVVFDGSGTYQMLPANNTGKVWCTIPIHAQKVVP